MLLAMTPWQLLLIVVLIAPAMLLGLFLAGLLLVSFLAILKDKPTATDDEEPQQ